LPKRSRRRLLAMLMLAPATARAARTLGERDDGASIALTPGESVTVILPENASTGYVWAVAEADPALVSVGAPRAAYAAPPGMVGGPGTASFTLIARAPGATTVALKRWRPWEGEAGVVQRWQVRLSIG